MSVALETNERILLGLIVEGLSTPEIAAQMEVTPRHVKYKIDLLRQKFGVRNKRELIRIAREMEATP